MILGWFFAIFTMLSAGFAIYCGTGAAVTAAAMEGADAGIRLAIRIAGPICLWSGVGALTERIGLTGYLGRLLRPLLGRLYPQARTDPALEGAISANFCANLLGLGNAATPMGIEAARRLQDPAHPEIATDGLCRLVVMNTASIQLLPTTVAAVRTGAGCTSPLDILPCVWISSLLSVSAGLAAAKLLGKVWRHG